MSFFEVSNDTRKPLPLVPACGRCGLFKTCKSPKMPVWGNGEKGFMIVGEAPGQTEDEKGRPFCGKAGARLKGHLEALGIDLKRDCWVTNSLICRPPNNIIKDRNAIDYCRPNIMAAIEKYKPHTVILLGMSAVKSVIGYAWKDGDIGEMARWVGWKIPSQLLNTWICPTWHPSWLDRLNDPLLDSFFHSHLKAAFKKKEHPYKKVPDYKSQVKIVEDEEIIMDGIYAIMSSGRPVAFDYETNVLKPDDKTIRDLVCCSMSDGLNTIIFPFTSKRVFRYFTVFLISNAPKIASNMKFEHRWSKRHFGVDVKNWLWDTMLAAHVLDNRHEVTSIKFQAFVLLGQPSYDDHVQPYLTSKKGGGYGKNRVRDCPRKDLLTYCGLDALLEWKVAEKQTKQMKHPAYRLFQRK